MKELILLVGPPGSGKSTLALDDVTKDFVYINQDKQGKEGHKKLFLEAIKNGQSVIVDRMNFNREQRLRYLIPAIDAGYKTRIVVIHESYETCFKRCLERQNHETIKNEKDARSALDFFFKNYERVQDNEAVEVQRVWPTHQNQQIVWCDLDGTLANCEHRRHFVNPDVKPQGFKKNWTSFFKEMVNDTPNEPVLEVLRKFEHSDGIVYCSGRPSNYQKETITWMSKYACPLGLLFMRDRSDQRPDNIVKEIMLEFEVKTRFNVLFAMDDRDQVVKMLRSHGVTVFQVAEGNF